MGLSDREIEQIKIEEIEELERTPKQWLELFLHFSKGSYEELLESRIRERIGLMEYAREHNISEDEAKEILFPNMMRRNMTEEEIEKVKNAFNEYFDEKDKLKTK